MRNNAWKGITSAALAVLLFFSAAVPAGAAAGTTEKEEVVYVRLSHDGRVDTIYVVNSFDLPGPGTIADRGSYSEVRNLTTTDAMQYSGGTVSVEAPGGKFYYEGVLQSKAIPWDISVEYWLDGKPISGDRLAGKSGALRMEFSVRQNPLGSTVYLDNYAIQASLSLDGERCVNIQAEDATIANVGKDKQLSYIILPGKEGSFTITAEVTNFEMDGISINAIPMVLNIDDPDTSEIKEKITELQDGAVELDDGARELDDGARELNDGAVELDDGATKLDDGVLTLEDGVAELEDGVEELRDGADDLQDGASELYNGTKDLRDGVDELEQGVARLSGGMTSFGAGFSEVDGRTEALVQGSAQVRQGIQALEAGVAGLDAESLQQLLQQAAALEAGSQQYLDTLDALLAGYEAQLRESLSLGYSSSEEVAVLRETVAVLQELRDSYVEINSGVAAMSAAVQQLQMLPQLVAGVQALAGQYTTLDAGLLLYTQGVGQLYSAYGELAAGAGDLSHGVGELKDGVGDLRSGARELYDGTYELQDGVNRLTDGAAELRDGATQLRDGTIELKDGTVELLDGTVELLDGTLELVDGTAELREKTADMDEEIDDRIDELLEEYRGKEFEPVSFVDRENRVSRVQFVMLTESIAVEEEEQTAVVTVEEKPTVFRRFVHLFAS